MMGCPRGEAGTRVLEQILGCKWDFGRHEVKVSLHQKSLNAAISVNYPAGPCARACAVLAFDPIRVELRREGERENSGGVDASFRLVRNCDVSHAEGSAECG